MVWPGFSISTAVVTFLQSCHADVLQGNVPFNAAHSTHTTTTTTSEVPVQFCLDQCNVIADMRFGWVDGCRDLDRIPSATDEEACRLSCCHDAECEVWQYGATGCWNGKAHHCNTKREDASFTGGQMITHGTAEVLNEDFKAPCPENKYLDIWTGTTIEKRDRCRDKCMANRMCTYWQLKAFDRCYYGDYLECEAEIAVDPNVKYGNRVSHVCRSAPASATLAATSSPDNEGDFGFWQLFIALLVFFVVSLAGICVVLTLMVRRNGTSKQRDEEEDLAPEDEDEADLDSYARSNE
eukprot:gnl/MRDRNA2_/MRDRNA2_80159_c0_seq1.p1 gnl/MRDRNA2_/MRDRNA2_80159_c0~~gnl/MRDRNA2_/MRDRNA2_80159_c0_seq1.p1  ORF type:complete len:295 (+),score=41.65 gnl/MRDRNA2_/MRDRNA2_80159_c0_seq1:91-975(+)